jgi:hypothetical protein
LTEPESQPNLSWALQLQCLTAAYSDFCESAAGHKDFAFLHDQTKQNYW